MKLHVKESTFLKEDYRSSIPDNRQKAEAAILRFHPRFRSSWIFATGMFSSSSRTISSTRKVLMVMARARRKSESSHE